MRLRLSDLKTIFRNGSRFVSPTHLNPSGNISGNHFCLRLSRPQGRSADRRIMSIKNSSDPIGYRTRDFPACCTVPQPTASLRAPYELMSGLLVIYRQFCKNKFCDFSVPAVSKCAGIKEGRHLHPVMCTRMVFTVYSCHSLLMHAEITNQSEVGFTSPTQFLSIIGHAK